MIIQGYKVTAKFIDRVPQPWGSERSAMYSNKFHVTVKKDGKRAQFNFYGSAVDCQNGKTELDADDLKHALYCFFSDALSGVNNFDDFVSGFGYEIETTKEYKEAQRTHRACQKQLEKAYRFVSTEEELCEICNALND